MEDVEVGCGYSVEQMEIVVVPAGVGSAGDVDGGAVVGEDEAIGFHSGEDDLVGGGIAKDVKAGFEAEARAHGRSGGVGAGGGVVRGRRNETGAGVGKSETNGVIDGAGSNLIVANQARKNGKAGGVGAGPGVRALFVGEKIPDGTGACVPNGGLRIGRVKLVEEAIGFIEDENVAIAGAGIRVAFDRSGQRNGHGAGVGFAAVRGVIDRDERLSGIDHGIRNTDVGAVVFAGAEVGMNSSG